MTTEVACRDDVSDIRALIERWVLWRDAGEWEHFKTLWHPQGVMIATWFQAPALEFVAKSQKAWTAGVQVLHTIGGTHVDIVGARAVAQTKMSIMQRGRVHGVLVDVTCYGRFWDALEKVGDTWLLRLRQPIYELDHIAAVDGGKAPTLDPAVLAQFPEGYRHLAYLQTQLGFDVSPNMPGTRGQEIEDLMARGRGWLAGAPEACLSAS